MDRSAVAVVIPAFNEAASIGDVVKSVLPFAQAVVVDDCSGDATSQLAADAGAIVVRHTENMGYDGALNSGFARAVEMGVNYVVTFDADGQHDPALIGRFVELLEGGADVVVGIRPHPARISEYLFAFCARLLYGLRDPLCGMKGYRMSLYQEQGWFDSYRSIGTELTLYGLKRNRVLRQLSVPISGRVGASRFGAVWKANYKILRSLALSFRVHGIVPPMRKKISHP